MKKTTTAAALQALHRQYLTATATAQPAILAAMLDFIR